MAATTRRYGLGGRGNATLHVVTRREGVAARVGHDLQLLAGRGEVSVELADGGDRGDLDVTVRVRVDATSLEVEGALEGAGHAERLNPKALGRLEKGVVHRTIQKDVLDARRHADVEAELSGALPAAAGEGGTLRGHVTLRGRRQDVTAEVTVAPGGRLEGRASVSLPAAGIVPPKALLGALTVAPDVEVRLALPELR